MEEEEETESADRVESVDELEGKPTFQDVFVVPELFELLVLLLDLGGCVNLWQATRCSGTLHALWTPGLRRRWGLRHHGEGFLEEIDEEMGRWTRAHHTEDHLLSSRKDHNDDLYHPWPLEHFRADRPTTFPQDDRSCVSCCLFLSSLAPPPFSNALVVSAGNATGGRLLFYVPVEGVLRCRLQVDTETFISSMAASPSGTLILCGNKRGVVTIIKMERHKATLIPTEMRCCTSDLSNHLFCFTEEDRFFIGGLDDDLVHECLITAGDDGNYYVEDLPVGTRRGRLGHFIDIFLEDCEYLPVGSRLGRLKLYLGRNRGARNDEEGQRVLFVVGDGGNPFVVIYHRGRIRHVQECWYRPSFYDRIRALEDVLGDLQAVIDGCSILQWTVSKDLDKMFVAVLTDQPAETFVQRSFSFTNTNEQPIPGGMRPYDDNLVNNVAVLELSFPENKPRLVTRFVVEQAFFKRVSFREVLEYDEIRSYLYYEEMVTIDCTRSFVGLHVREEAYYMMSLDKPNSGDYYCLPAKKRDLSCSTDDGELLVFASSCDPDADLADSLEVRRRCGAYDKFFRPPSPGVGPRGTTSASPPELRVQKLCESRRK